MRVLWGLVDLRAFEVSTGWDARFRRVNEWPWDQNWHRWGLL